MKIIVSLYIILLIVFVILSLVIIKHQERINQIYCRQLIKNKRKTEEISDFIRIKHNDILSKKAKFERDYSNIKSLHSKTELATFACLYAVYREEILLNEIANFIRERG